MGGETDFPKGRFPGVADGRAVITALERGLRIPFFTTSRDAAAAVLEEREVTPEFVTEDTEDAGRIRR